MLTHARLKELLHYNRATGVFTWRVYRGPNAHAGSVAGTLAPNGYVKIMIDHRNYYAQVLAWFYVTAARPTIEIDHRDWNRANNAWKNLRVASRSENQCNTRAYSTNTSGVKGVTWHKASRKWMAQIVLDYKRHYLGLFDTIEEAAGARRTAAERLHGQFAGELRL